MPHAMTEAFMIEETSAGLPAAQSEVAPRRHSTRQHESETPNERAMRTATAARRKSEPQKRQQG